MIRLCKLSITLITVVTCGVVCAPSAKADTLVFRDVRLAFLGLTPPGGIDLFSNPSISFTAAVPNNVALISIGTLGTPPQGGDILRLSVTATNENDTFVITNPNPASLNIPINSTNAGHTFNTGFMFPTSYQGTTIRITVDLLNSAPDFIIPSGINAGQRVDSYTYTFTVVQPVPEPATLIL